VLTLQSRKSTLQSRELTLQSRAIPGGGTPFLAAG
jgi:hypothetical protein